MTSRRAWTDYLSTKKVNDPLFDKSTKSKKRKKGTTKPPKPLERDIKRMIVQALKLHPLVAEVKVVGVSCGQVKRPDGSLTAWRQWGEAGTPDIVGRLKDGRRFRIEVKTPARRNCVSPAQREMLDETVAAGGLAGVACSIEDAFRIIDGSEA